MQALIFERLNAGFEMRVIGQNGQREEPREARAGGRNGE
jgi:hypothetical protein